MKRHFVWTLTKLMLIGLLGLASINLAAGGTWTRKVDMPTPRWLLSTSAVDGKIYAIGGTTDSGWGSPVFPTVEVYDTATDTWTKKADMPTPRWGLSTCVLDGKIYAFGGTDGSSILSTVEEYDPKMDTWTKKANMPTPRFMFSTYVVDGKIYVIGGAIDSSEVGVSTVETYDPTTGLWTKKASMPTPKLGLSTSVVDGKIYVVGGTSGSPSNWEGISTVEAYDPVTDIWTKKADMLTPKTWLSTSVVGEKIYAIGGTQGSGERSNWPGISTVEAYDPATDTWMNKASMPTPRCGLSTGVMNRKIYAIGGWETYPGAGLAAVEEYTPEGWQPTAVSPQGKLTTTWGKVKQGR